MSALTKSGIVVLCAVALMLMAPAVAQEKAGCCSSGGKGEAASCCSSKTEESKSCCSGGGDHAEHGAEAASDDAHASHGDAQAAATAHGKHGKGGHGGEAAGVPGKTKPELMADAHTLLNEHASITRTVEQLPNGVRTVTTTTDPELVAVLQRHPREMAAHLKAGGRVRNGDPVFRGLADHAKEVEISYKDIENGVIATVTSKNEEVVELIRQHAAKVTAMSERGRAAMHEGLGGKGGHGKKGGGGGHGKHGGAGHEEH